VEEFKDEEIKRNEKVVENNDRKNENVTIRKNKVGKGRKNRRKEEYKKEQTN
jgi:hypothetical protein